MLCSVRWLNSLLRPGALGVAAIDEALTFAGFPIQETEALPEGDTRLDVEITSNRGDCLCHAGLAQEVAAATGQALALPEVSVPAPAGAAIDTAFSLEVSVPDDCPRFTLRLIRGVKVGPSPAWLVEALESVGQRSVNNVVDATNYLLLGFGSPSHVFDASRVRGGKVVVRRAAQGESVVSLQRERLGLTGGDVVVADAEGPLSVAGVIGGQESSVTESTTDVLVEVATWRTTSVRAASRRHKTRTDSSHRFERTVDARTLDAAADRLVSVIVALAGGELAPGVLDVSAADTSKAVVVPMRAGRCRSLLGIDTAADEMARLLGALGVGVQRDGQTLLCTVPPTRPDLTREIDIIEEIARLVGFAAIPVDEKVTVLARGLQPDAEAGSVIAETLAACGFDEAVTYTFVTPEEASLYLPDGASLIEVDPERRREAPALRPCATPSLLRCLRRSIDAGAVPAGAGRLFERSSGFYGTRPAGRGSVEADLVCVAADASDAQEGVRLVRGAVELVVKRLAGACAVVVVEPGAPVKSAELEGSCAQVTVGGTAVGRFYLVSPAALAAYKFQTPVVVAELDAAALVGLYPPASGSQSPPAFPAIDRDLSVVVPEATPWADIQRVVAGAAPALLEGVDLVGVYRGKQAGAGKKSVTLRLRFRDGSRTLRHDEVDPQVASVLDALAGALGALLRA